MNDDDNARMTALGGALLKAMPYIPKTQLIECLRTIVERLTFSGLEGIDKISDEDIDMLFAHDQPRSMLMYLKWARSRGHMPLFVGDRGYTFVSYVSSVLSMFKEVEFVTAVKISTELQDYVSDKLFKVFGADSRIVFVIVPSLVAGYALRYDGSQQDYSLAGISGKNIFQYIVEHQPKFKAAMGKLKR